VPFDWGGDLVYFLDKNTEDTGVQILRDCLKDHSYNPNTYEAIIHEPNVALNIWDWARSDDHTKIQRMKDKMFIDNGAGTYTTYAVSANPRETEVPISRWAFHNPAWDGIEFKIRCRPEVKSDREEEWLFVDLEAGN
jgi:hypothetical protein